MSVDIRIRDLVKIYRSAPPAGAMRGTVGGAARPGPAPTRGLLRRRPKIEVTALAGISLDVPGGSMFGLLGPNGAGKTTTLGILTTRVRATSGEAFIGGLSVAAEPQAVKREIGVVPQRPNLDLALTAREVLVFHGAYFGLPRATVRRRAGELLERFQLTARAGDMVRDFSGGMAQRLSIARSLMHDPQVLFLDEPSAGLDPQTRVLLWDLVRAEHRRGKTVLVTTHYMEEADALCDRIAIVDHGQIIADGTPAELKDQVPGGYVLRLRFDRVDEPLVERLRGVTGVREVRNDGSAAAEGHAADGWLDVYADRGGTLVPQLLDCAISHGLELRDLHIAEPSLENLFLHYTGRSLRE
jgi:ABC-2 type transport system ATP-binding protein